MIPSIADFASNKLKFILKMVSGLALLGGAGIGLLTLSSAAGIWLGIWDFRVSFDILRIANTYGDVVALVCLAATVTVIIATQFFKTGNTVKLGSIAALGTMIAAIAYYIPESFRPGEGVSYPPIHDISTDTISPPEFVDVLPLRVNAPNTVVYGGSANMTPERLAHLSRQAYPDLVAQSYSATAETVFSKALAAVDKLGWELVAQVPAEGRIEATATTFWFRFKDDVVIIIERQGAETIVNARSLSRVGGGDVGANAIRLRAFFALL